MENELKSINESLERLEEGKLPEEQAVAALKSAVSLTQDLKALIKDVVVPRFPNSDAIVSAVADMKNGVMRISDPIQRKRAMFRNPLMTQEELRLLGLSSHLLADAPKHPDKGRRRFHLFGRRELTLENVAELTRRARIDTKAKKQLVKAFFTSRGEPRAVASELLKQYPWLEGYAKSIARPEIPGRPSSLDRLMRQVWHEFSHPGAPLAFSTIALVLSLILTMALHLGSRAVANPAPVTQSAPTTPTVSLPPTALQELARSKWADAVNGKTLIILPVPGARDVESVLAAQSEKCRIISVERAECILGKDVPVGRDWINDDDILAVEKPISAPTTAPTTAPSDAAATAKLSDNTVVVSIEPAGSGQQRIMFYGPDGTVLHAVEGAAWTSSSSFTIDHYIDRFMTDMRLNKTKLASRRLRECRQIAQSPIDFGRIHLLGGWLAYAEHGGVNPETTHEFELALGSLKEGQLNSLEAAEQQLFSKVDANCKTPPSAQQLAADVNLQPQTTGPIVAK